jgi:hypothetical protein
MHHVAHHAHRAVGAAPRYNQKVGQTRQFTAAALAADTLHRSMISRRTRVIIGRLVGAVGDIIPAYHTALLRWSGVLIVGGAALLGFAFPLI